MQINTTICDFFIQQEQLELNDFISPKVQLMRYNPAAYSDELYRQFHIHQPLQANLWADKRKAQYLAGRLAARESLRAINSPASEQPIPTGHHREPMWPTNVLGSISHAEGFSVATTTHKNLTCHGIGLDIQSIVSDEDLELITPAVLTEKDRKLYENNNTGLTSRQLFTLIFSAKESFFKAAYGSVREYFDFNAISICDIDVEYQQIIVSCEKDLCDEIVTQNEYPIFVDILEIGEPVVMTYSVV